MKPLLIALGLLCSVACANTRFEPLTTSEPTNTTASVPRRTEPREVVLAVVQMESRNGAVRRNLSEASRWLEKAVAADAELIVFPEFMPNGYSLDYDAWDSAEPRGGPTELWLRNEARRLAVHVGTSYLEADGEDFFNTFALATPAGEIVGRVRKAVPAGLEGRLFRGDRGPRVLDTSLGRIGIGICQESYRCYLSSELHSQSADVLLLPHSYPDLSESGGLEAPPGRFVATWYARELGIPVAMVNKTGRWSSSLPELSQPIVGRFPGQSAIARAGGDIAAELQRAPGFALARVRLDPSRKRVPQADCTGGFVNDLTLGGPVRRWFTRIQIRMVTWLGLSSRESRALDAYTRHPDRAAKARAISSERARRETASELESQSRQAPFQP